MLLTNAYAGEKIIYSAAGNITHQNYRKDGSIAARFNLDFLINMDDCRWKITTIREKSDPEMMITNVAIFDGENLATIKFHNDEFYQLDNSRNTNDKFHPFRLPSRTTQKKAKNRATAVISKDQMPDMNPNFILPIWIAFASHCFRMNSETDLKPPWPTTTLSSRSLHFPFHAFWQSSEKSPYLPVSLIFVRSSKPIQKKSDPSDPENNSWWKGNSKYTNFIYEATNWKTVGSFQLPMSGRFERFRNPNSKIASKELLASTEFTVKEFGRGSSVKAVSIPKDVIVVEKRKDITDLRAPVIYFSKEGVIKDSTTIKKVPGYQEALAKEARSMTGVNGFKVELFGLILIGLMFLAPIAFFSIRRKG